MAGEITGPPQVNFYSMLSGLGDTIQANRIAQAKKDAIASALTPGADGKVDFGRAMLGLLPVDPQAASILASRQNHQDQLAQTAADRERQSRRDAIDDRFRSASLALQQRAANRADDPTPAGFEKAPEGGVVPLKGGPADPNYLAIKEKAIAQPRKLTVSDIGKLSEEGQKFATLTNVNDKFEDRFAGYGVPGAAGAAMAAGRYLPEGVVGKDVADGAAYWQNYDRYKNVVRNELFGASLTAGEQQAFEKADISPGMQPAQIRKNLAMQKSVVENGLKRKASAMIEAGYDPATISKAYGVDLNGAAGKVEPATATAPVDWRTYFGGQK